MTGTFLFSILINLTNAWLVYTVVSLVHQRRLIAIIAGILFLVHPFLWWGLGESTSQQKGLFLSCFLLAFIFFKTLTPSKGINYLNSLVLFLLALLFSREAFVFPFFLLLYDCHFMTENSPDFSKRWKKYYPFFEVLGLFLAFQYIIFGPNLIPVTRSQDLLTTISYIPINFLYCFSLAPDLTSQSSIFAIMDLFEYFFCIAAVILFILLSIKLYRFSRELSFISLWLFISLFCTLYQTLSGEPHNYYLSLVAVSWFLGWLFFQLWSSRHLFMKYLTLLSFFSIVGFYLIANIIHERPPIIPKQGPPSFISPDLADYHFFLAYAYQRVGKYTQAIKENNLALRLNPLAIHPHLNLGVIYNQLGEYDRAINELQEVLKVFPYHLYALNWLGDVYKKLGKWEKAKEQYLKTVIFDPDNVVARNNLGVIYFREGKKREARAHFQHVLKIDPFDGVAKEFLERMGVNNK